MTFMTYITFIYIYIYIYIRFDRWQACDVYDVYNVYIYIHTHTYVSTGGGRDLAGVVQWRRGRGGDGNVCV